MSQLFSAYQPASLKVFLLRGAVQNVNIEARVVLSLCNPTVSHTLVPAG